MNRWVLCTLLFAPLTAVAEDRAAPDRVDPGAAQKPNVRTYLRVTVVEDPSKAPPLPTSRPAADRLLRPGEKAPPRIPERPAPPAADRPLRPDSQEGAPRSALRDGAPREDAQDLRQLRQELRKERGELRKDAPERPTERPAERLRERVRERVRDGNRPLRNGN